MGSNANLVHRNGLSVPHLFVVGILTNAAGGRVCQYTQPPAARQRSTTIVWLDAHFSPTSPFIRIQNTVKDN